MKALNSIWGTMAVADQTTQKTRDALFGAWYLLSMQSLCLQDGWTDFLALVRGCGLVTAASLGERKTSAWGMDRVESALERIYKEWHEGRIDPPSSRLTAGMLKSLRRLETDCHAYMHQEFLKVLTTAADLLENNDIWQGYRALQSIWHLLAEVNAVDFKALEDCSKPVTRILIAHWLAMLLLLKPFYDLEAMVGNHAFGAQLPTWIFDISRTPELDVSSIGGTLQWPVEVALAFATQGSAHASLCDQQNRTGITLEHAIPYTDSKADEADTSVRLLFQLHEV